MRKVYGIGETICDIIFKDNQPVAAKAGGSTFNAMVTLGRMGVNTSFMSMVGGDMLGQNIINFMKENNVSTENLTVLGGHKTDVALAFLDENGDAQYSFYKDNTKLMNDENVPNFKRDDILLLGSFFSLNPILRPYVKSVLNAARAAQAIIYYDPNFRSSHLHELEILRSTIYENIDIAAIIRGSDEDFRNIFGEKGNFLKELTNLASQLLITRNAAGVDVIDSGLDYHFSAKPIVPVSTIGAGDNFNAGFIYALIKYDIRFDDIKRLNKKDWQNLVETAVDFSTEVCLSYDNYVSLEFAEKYSKN